MEVRLDVILYDKSKNLIEEQSIEKPKTYEDLLHIIKIKMLYLPNYYNIFVKKGKENIIINNNETYKLAEDKIFICETDHLADSSNSNILSESKKIIIDEKYMCYICRENIKEKKPLMCY